jgi:predicted TIM-barrel fold metal-dependent hydrolase
VICDTDTRIWSSRDELGPVLGGLLRRAAADRLVVTEANEDAHAVAMRPVARAFVLGSKARRLQCDQRNEVLALAIRSRPDRLVGFAGIDPLSPDWRDELERAQDLGFAGISVSPSLQGCPPTHAQAMRLWERCVEKGLPVVVSRPTPMPPAAIMECDRPTHWDEALRSFPSLRVLFASFGTPYIEETLILLAKFENTYTHCAASLRRPMDAYRWLCAAADAGVLGKVLFASGFPFETPAAALERLYGLTVAIHGTGLPTLPRRELQNIAQRNALALLGIRDRGTLLVDGEQQALLTAAESLRQAE